MKNTSYLRLVLLLVIAITLFVCIPRIALVQHEAAPSNFDVPNKEGSFGEEEQGGNIIADVGHLQTYNHQNGTRSSLSNNNNNNNNNISICFLTAVYAKWAAHADKLQNVTDYNADNDDFSFFVYTNLPRLKTHGWTRIIKTHTNYNRFITQSRWPKFLAWNDTTTNNFIRNGRCDVIFYLDSIGHLIGTPDDFRRMARDIYDSPVGLAQYKHRGGNGAYGEFRRIEVFKKDLDENIKASKEWLSAQPDFRPYNCTLYENRYFGYRIDSEAFRKASTFLWDHYSLEQDSWRDQPLWCYVLDHFNITPIPLRHKELFILRTSRMGKAKHNYDATSEGDAKRAREKAEGGGGGGEKS